MKTCITLLLFSAILSACSPPQKPAPVVGTTAPDSTKVIPPPPPPGKDSTFILREIRGNNYHAIFIDTAHNSECYKELTNFHFNSYALETFQSSCQALHEKKAVVRHFNRHQLPAVWLPLYQYQQQFYLYCPSDWGNNGCRIISDSMLIYYYLDGPYPFVITKMEQKGAGQYRITSKDYLNNEDVIVKPEILNIYIVDRKKQLAVFEYMDAGGEDFRYKLYVAKEQAGNFDMIVNHSNSKQMEFEFEEIDFKKLLRR